MHGDFLYLCVRQPERDFCWEDYLSPEEAFGAANIQKW